MQSLYAAAAGKGVLLLTWRGHGTVLLGHGAQLLLQQRAQQAHGANRQCTVHRRQQLLDLLAQEAQAGGQQRQQQLLQALAQRLAKLGGQGLQVGVGV